MMGDPDIAISVLSSRDSPRRPSRYTLAVQADSGEWLTKYPGWRSILASAVLTEYGTETIVHGWGWRTIGNRTSLKRFN
jgi:hypothetical protein